MKFVIVPQRLRDVDYSTPGGVFRAGILIGGCYLAPAAFVFGLVEGLFGLDGNPFRLGLALATRTFLGSIGVTVVYLVANKVGLAVAGIGVNLLFGSSATTTVREQLGADLQRAKQARIEKDYERALAIVDSIIVKDPQHAEALYLRAQILWEGYRQSGAARACLEQVMAITNAADALHKWSRSYLGKIVDSTVSDGGVLENDDHRGRP